VLTASSTSTVDPASNTATDTGLAESAGVNVLGGLVTADVVRAVANAKATGFNASVSIAGSAFKNLVVNGTQLNNVDPNTRIDLPAAAFGLGSYVALLEETASISQPPAGQISGGSFAADVTVNMIHVHIAGVIGGIEAADVNRLAGCGACRLPAAGRLSGAGGDRQRRRDDPRRADRSCGAAGAVWPRRDSTPGWA